MGAGNTTLTPLQGAEVARVMKEEYRNIQNSTITNEEQRQMLLKKYEEVIKRVTVSPLKVVTSNAKRSNRGYSKDENGLGKSGPTRRRSFENPSKSTNPSSRGAPKKEQSIVEKLAESQSLSTIESSVALGTAPPQVDSWESVNGQPSCLICGMVFATAAKLKTHVNFSSLHASNVKKMEEAPPAVEVKDTESVEVAPAEPTARCRVMYTGSKLFWKTQDNFDIHIYLHKDARCIEVIPYDSGTSSELPRIYLSEDVLLRLLGESVIIDRVKEIQRNAANQRFKESLPPYAALFDEEKRIVLSSHIIAHLQMSHNTEKKDIYSKSLQYVHGNGGGDGVVHAVKPEGVVPVFIARRRHSSEQEIKETMDDISHMQQDIRGMTERAERMANLVTRSAETFSGAGKRKKAMEKLSVPTRRWKWAINLVLLQNRVLATQRILASYNGKY